MARVAQILLLVLSIAIGVVGWLFAASEWRRGAERTRAADLQLRSAETDAVAQRDVVADRDRRIGFLEQELAAALRRGEEITAEVDRRIAGFEAQLAAQRDHLARVRAPMPEGVRLAVLAFNQCLAADGYPHLRVIEARQIADRRLLEVELIEVLADGRPTRYYRIGSLALLLDRERGSMTLRMEDGEALAGSGPEPIPASGRFIELPEIAGRMWEARLPYLVEASGDYPAPEVADPTAEAMVDPWTLERWRERVNRLLEGAGTELLYAIDRAEDLRGARFRGVVLVGKSAGRAVVEAADAQAVGIEIDRESGRVWLLLEDGALHKPGGETAIPATGYRILLPDVTIEQAMQAMMGLVVFRS